MPDICAGQRLTDGSGGGNWVLTTAIGAWHARVWDVRPRGATLTCVTDRSATTLRRVATAIAATTVAVLLSGCQVFSPNQVSDFPPGPGIDTSIGTLKVQNIAVIANAKGALGALTGAVTNTGTTDATLTVQTSAQALAKSGGANIAVPAGKTVPLAGTPVTDVSQPPGALMTLVLSTPQTGTSESLVPVLTATDYFATVTPTTTPTP